MRRVVFFTAAVEDLDRRAGDALFFRAGGAMV